MAYLFGYRLGVVGNDGMFHSGANSFLPRNVNTTQGSIKPNDFGIGDSMTVLMNLKVGDILTNRSGDFIEVQGVSDSTNITGITKGVIHIVSGDYSGEYAWDYDTDYQYIFTGIRATADEDTRRAWLPGSYIFMHTDSDGVIYLGHPTRVAKDFSLTAINDSSVGVATIHNGEVNWINQNDGITGTILITFAYFCARELTFDAPDIDPFKPGGDSETGGGTGDFNNISDNIDLPILPGLTAVDTGFISLFNPTLEQLKNLCSYIWSDLFSLDTLKKLFADPMGAILGLSIVPVNVPFAGANIVRIGNIDTDIVMNRATTQFVAVDCGSLNLNEYWGAYLDFDPYTKIEIYLPYIGTRHLSTDDVMGKTINVTYHVDILTGACCAYIRCNGSVLYTFTGHCAIPIPITGSDWTNVINGALSVAGSVASTVATGGALAPMAVSSVATAVNSAKPMIEKSGNMSGTGGMLGVQTPYIIVTRPRQAKPDRQSKFMGYPSFITTKLGDITGYTEIETIFIENIPATQEEIAEIETLLKGGVVL